MAATVREVETRAVEGSSLVLGAQRVSLMRWYPRQAALRIRTVEDGIADVRGIPFEKQNAFAHAPSRE